MSVKYTNTLFATTYKDDFKDSDHYHRVLFNSGKSLQARELTQSQTIIQREIERFGRNIFKEGASVNPGGLTINTRYEFIKLDTTTNALPADTQPMVGDEFTGQTSSVKFKVLEVIAATASDPATLYVNYTNTLSATATADPIRMSPGENLIGGSSGVTVTAQTTNTVANPAVGQGCKISVRGGDYFTQGHFVFAAKQEMLLSKYTSTPSAIVGFIVSQDIVGSGDFEALFDNQGATPNRSAPGADRYRIRLQLTTQDLVDSDENFLFFCKVVDGIVVETVTGNKSYNLLEDRLARRTREITGDFIAKPFKIKYVPHATDDTKLKLTISPGVAYVQGYRVELSTPKQFDVNKSRETISVNNDVVAATYGNYIVVNNLVGTPNVNVFQQRNLRSAVTHGGSTIGTCRIRAIEKDGANFRLYLFEIKMDAGQSFRDVKSIGGSIIDYADLLLENSKAVLKEVSDNNLLFSLPTERPKLISDISLEVQRKFNATLDPSGNASLTLTASGETFANTSDWILSVDSDGDIISPTLSGAGTQSATISGGPTSTNVEVIAKVNKSAGAVRTKTLVETTLSAAIESDGLGNDYIDLDKPDLYSVVRLTDSDSNGASLYNRFIIDNGQRDNFYAPARLNLKGGVTKPAGNVFVRFKYFTHGASGDFFAVNSYQGQVNYEDIPSHTKNDGSVVQLRNVLDFRPRKTDRDSDFTSATARINELPDNTDLITFDTEYYLPRFDKIIATPEGEITAIEGKSALTPKYPETPNNGLEFYRVKMNPYTIGATDMSVTPIETKKYTMSDIGKLEQRIDQVEEMATLSLLELDLKNLLVFDSTGTDRTKAGFLVDNFSDQLASDTRNVEYRASIDPRDKILRPSFIENSVLLKYDSNASSNVIKKGDNIYIKHTEQEYITQPQASGTININPFSAITNLGNVTLSPASDNWRETVRGADRIIDGGNRLDTTQSQLWNNWEWNWGGTDANNLSIGQVVNQSTSSLQVNFTRRGGAGQAWNMAESGTETQTTTAVSRVVLSETIREIVGDRVVDVALVPFMRSQRVFFKAEGLKPNSRMFAYFDDTDVSDWVRDEGGVFTRVSDANIDYGTRYNSATQHPEGPSSLFTDGEGKMTGSFFIPNTDAIKFRSGTRELKLLDITSSEEDFATSVGIALFTAQGVIETMQRDVRSTRLLNVQTEESTISSNRIVTRRWRWADPVAESFQITETDGVFITKIDAYFKTKDPTVPVQCQLRPMVNGSPASDSIIPGSSVFLSPASVNISDDASAATTFTFEEPIFLNPYTEYALVFLAESVNYNMFVAETGEFILGSTERRITSQPYLGSFFKSQNASTWEPDQTMDLMFKIHRAVFSTSPAYATLENTGTVRNQLPEFPVEVNSTDNKAIVTHPGHGFSVGDQAELFGFDSALKYGGILGSDIMGPRTITARDANTYTFAMDSNGQRDAAVGGTAITAKSQVPFETVIPQIENIIPSSTNIALSGKFTSGKSIAGEEAPFVKDAAFQTLAIKQNNFFNSPRIIATEANEVSNLAAGTKSATIKIDMVTTEPRVSPIIDMQRTSLWAIHNVIDNQVDSAGADTVTTNLPTVFTAETTATGGSSVAKHITRPVTLANDAVGLKVLLAANRPSVADFQVYYKAIGDDILFNETPWTEVVRLASPPTDENPLVYRDYEYLVGGKDGLASPFTKFAIKIVMTSSNNAKVPTFKDLRVIALAI